NVSAGKPRVIFDGAFAEAAVNPQNGDVAVVVRAENNNPRKVAGIYYSSNSGTTFEALLAGEYKNLSYAPEIGLFTASGTLGVLQFDRNGSVFMLTGEERLRIAPDGHRLMGWGGIAARLLRPRGFS